MAGIYRDKFYYGFGGEHFIISQFYAMKYEAVKMEVDFGYDILVTNQYRKSADVDKELKTLALQVKTRSIFKENIVMREIDQLGIGYFARIDFYIKKEDYNLITNSDNGFLVCVFIDKTATYYNPVGKFWLSSKHLEEVRQQGFLNDGSYRKKDDYYFITAELPMKHNVNHLAEFCIDRLKESSLGTSQSENEYLTYLSELISESEISITQSLNEINLLSIDSETANYSTSRLPLKSHLTDLSNIPNEDEIKIQWTDEEFIGRERFNSNVTETIGYKKMLFDFDLND